MITIFDYAYKIYSALYLMPTIYHLFNVVLLELHHSFVSLPNLDHLSVQLSSSILILHLRLFLVLLHEKYMNKLHKESV